MSGKRRSERESVFTFRYAIRGLAALETMGDASEDNGRPFDSWSDEYLGQLIYHRLEDLTHEKESVSYKGSISIVLRELKHASAIVGIDKRTRLQKHESGPHGPLPEAVFDVSVTIKGLEGNVRRGLLVLLEEGSVSDWEQLAKRFVRIEQVLEGHGGKLGRLSESFLNRMEKIAEAFKAILGLFDVSVDVDARIDRQSFYDIVLSKLRDIDISDERAALQLRSLVAQYLELYKDLVKHNAKRIRLKNLDVDAVESFGKDLFLILKHYMNKILRLLRYSFQQYWLQEIPDHEAGYFYIDNEVRMDGKGPLIPITRHHHEIDRIPEDFVIATKEWTNILTILSDEGRLSEHIESFTLGGIFSQAAMSIENEHLENAVILALVALEAAMTQVLERFYTDEGTSGTAGEKCGLVKCILRSSNLGGITTNEWRLIEGKPKPRFPVGDYRNYHDGLIPVRNGVQHRRERIDPDQRGRIVEYITTARRIAYRLIKWLELEPPREIGNKCRKHIKWARRKRRR